MTRTCGRFLQAALGVAEQREQLVADDLDDLLTRRQALEHRLIHRAVTHAIDERGYDLEVDVGLEQGRTDLAERGFDGLFSETCLAAERLEDVLEAGAERVEHERVVCRVERPCRVPRTSDKPLS